MRRPGLRVAERIDQDAQWPDTLVSLLKQIPASAFQAVSESCLMASRNSGKATAKPGCAVG